MFMTDEVFRSPLSGLLREAGCTYWPTVELGLQRMWFLMSVREALHSDGKSYDIDRTTLISDFQFFEQFLQAYEAKEIRLNSIQIVTPGHMNGTNSWAMDVLAKIWDAQEPDEPNQTALVFETKSGRRFTNSMLGTPAEAFSVDSLKYASPN